MKSLVLSIFLIGAILTAPEARAAETACVPPTLDKYWPSVHLPKNLTNRKVAGECMDTKLARGLRIIDPSEIKDLKRRAGSYIYVANFRHLDQYWFAEIPLDGVEQVLVQAEVSETGSAFHNETRFLMFQDQPVKIFAQVAGQKPPAAKLDREITDFVFTGVNLRPMSMMGPTFTIMRGIEGFFIQSFSLMSMHDTFFSETGADKDFEQYRLKLDASQRKNLLLYSIQYSDRVRESELYNTLTNNCITELFDGLYSVMRFHTHTEKQIFNTLNGRVWLPELVVPMLQKLQFIDDPESSRAPRFREELRTGILPIPLQGGGEFFRDDPTNEGEKF